MKKVQINQLIDQTLVQKKTQEYKERFDPNKNFSQPTETVVVQYPKLVVSDNDQIIDPYYSDFRGQYFLPKKELVEKRICSTRWDEDEVTVFHLNKDRHISTITSYDCPMPDCVGAVTREQGVWYGHCSTSFCPAVLIFFVPTVLQEAVVGNDIDDILLTIGGFGSGKTTTNAAKVFRHLLTIPRARILAAAQTQDQLQSVGQAELEKFISPKLFRKKNEKVWVLTNGSQIEWIASDKEDKIRGRNATMAWAIEVNKFKIDFIEQLCARIRSDNAIVYDLDSNGQKQTVIDNYGFLRVKTKHNYNQIILESNPDPNSDVLRAYWKRARTFFATSLVKDPESYISQLDMVSKEQFQVCVYITTGLDNPYLDKKTIGELNSLQDDARRIYVECDLSLKAGIVYDKWEHAVIRADSVEIPIDWPRLFAADFGGGSAPTALGAIAIDPNTGVAYLYDYFQKIDSAVSAHAPWMWEMIYGSSNTKKPPWRVLDVLGDPSGNYLREGSLSPLFVQYAEYGIHFSPAENSKGKRKKEINGTAITNDMMALGMLKILDTPKTALLIKQLQTISYKYVSSKSSFDQAAVMEVIEERGPFRNEGADITRYMAVWLAQNEMIIKNKKRLTLGHNTESNPEMVRINGRLSVDCSANNYNSFSSSVDTYSTPIVGFLKNYNRERNR